MKMTQGHAKQAIRGVTPPPCLLPPPPPRVKLLLEENDNLKILIQLRFHRSPVLLGSSLCQKGYAGGCHVPPRHRGLLSRLFHLRVPPQVRSREQVHLPPSR